MVYDGVVLSKAKVADDVPDKEPNGYQTDLCQRLIVCIVCSIQTIELVGRLLSQTA